MSQIFKRNDKPIRDWFTRFVSLLDSIATSSPSRGDEKAEEVQNQMRYFVGNDLWSKTFDQADEVFTGNFYTTPDGEVKRIYRKVIHADNFDVSNSFGFIKHNVPFKDKIIPISVDGYVDNKYATYAHYWTFGKDTETSPLGVVAWYWTGDGNFDVRLVITYAK